MAETGLRAAFTRKNGEWRVRFLNLRPISPSLKDAAADLALFVLANPDSVGSLILLLEQPEAMQ